MALAHNEAEAYRRLHPELSEVMPALYGAASDGRGHAVVILEDLSVRDAAFPPLATGATAEQALAVAGALATVHQKFWESPRFDADLAYLSPTRSRNTRLGPHSWHLLHTIPKDFNDIAPPEIRVGRRRCSSSTAGRSRHSCAPIRTRSSTAIHTWATSVSSAIGPCCSTGRSPPAGRPSRTSPISLPRPSTSDTRRAIDTDLVRTYVDTLNADGTTRLTFDDAWDSYQLFAFTAYIAAGVTAAFGRRLQGEATDAGRPRSGCASAPRLRFARSITRSPRAGRGVSGRQAGAKVGSVPRRRAPPFRLDAPRRGVRTRLSTTSTTCHQVE